MRKILLLTISLFFILCKTENKIVPISIDEVRNLGLLLQNKVEDNDIRGINELYDVQAFVNLFLKKSTKKSVHEFNASFYYGFARQFSFGELLIAQKNEGSFQLIRAYQDNNKDFHLLFRLYNEGLNYHSYTIKRIKGELKIIDMYVYRSGENLSDTYRAYYKKLLYGSNLFNTNVQDESLYKDVEKLNRIRDLNADGKFKKSYKIYKTISNSSKRMKTFKLANILICSYLSDDLYLEAIKDYEMRFPNDPSLFLISVDALIMKKEFDKTLSYIDKLDESLGGDPFLHFIRGNIHYMNKNYDSALGKFAITTLEYPEFINAYECSLMIYLETDKKEKVIEILETYNSEFKIPKKELKQNMISISPNFVKTKDFKTWFSKN
jgi:hypothetical protein